ncbi:tetratricopeptide repeat-containing sulfotransferase family protein [Acetobacter ghanensis]|nr:tetratricopeptide repeat-containing sulfotransferase family protein [Acetobacter ghanensis]NHO39291.1 tetratricopeptide repeat protein [Acetobacter ghanensis]GBQ49698.1 sulfotransferase [Acetobacter ghanensis DSM 18895]
MQNVNKDTASIQNGGANAINLSSETGMDQAVNDALRYATTLLTQAPDHPEALLLIGTIHTWQRHFVQAIPFLQRATVLLPQNAEAFNTLGFALYNTGRLEDAIVAFREAIKLKPDFPSAQTRLEKALTALDHHKNRVKRYHELLEIDANIEEIARYRAVLAVDSKDISALNGLGKALHASGRSEEAIEPFRLALSYNPVCTESARNLVQILVELDRVEEGIACCRAILDHDPNLPAFHAGAGSLLRKVGRHVEALHYLEQACALQPDNAWFHAVLALIARELGHIDLAITHLRQAITLDPNETNYYLSLTLLTKLMADDPALAAMQMLVKREDTLGDQEKMRLHFALGKALADSGQHCTAFNHQLKANALRRAAIPYDETRIVKGARLVRKHFTAAAIAATAETGHISACPVFIVGMPRSGSTLVEQILASHPQVYGAGEVSTLSDTLKDAAKRFPDWKLGTSLAGLSVRDRHFIAEDYLSRLNKLVVNWAGEHAPTRISNKMLDNFNYIGLIRQLWPNARIIHTVRDPIDTCLSCFSIPFDHLDFAFDLGELGRYYHHYQEQMAHWSRVLPKGAILNVHYEHIVENLEASARRIIAYCDLPWDETCLRFYECRRKVMTSSLAQVRQPIYRSAVGRWRPDAATLQPLLDGLKGRPTKLRTPFESRI